MKPSNVMIEDDSGVAALTDYGVARGDADSTLTQAGHVVGTVDYLAPEIIRGETATASSDLYSLGCLAYECIVGAPPFVERTLAETCVAHLAEPPRHPSAVRAEIPQSLGDALLTALGKRPDDRPATGIAYARLLTAAAR